jgi:hypothetical protein
MATDRITIIEDGEEMSVKASQLPLIADLVFKCDDPECGGAYHIKTGYKWESVEACILEREQAT